MVKNKRNAGLADRVNLKRKTEGVNKKLNPFEVHINKEKIKILGRKSKHDRGLPGVSRAKAIQKRKETLGKEMKLMNKSNAFIDKRIGENNNQLSAEERIIARYAAERAGPQSKKNIYNLADDEIWTHRGQTLEQIEKFDDPRSSDEEDEDGKKFGGLDDDFVSEGHFGGGTLPKTEFKDGTKSHKDLVEQLIAESKKRKAEKQEEKEKILDLTEKLDSEWKDLQPVVFKKARVEEKKESIIDKLLSQAEKKNEDYDKMMRELKFEKRGTPSDGLKSSEKEAKEEKERLEKLEKERDMRMLDDGETLLSKSKPSTPKHRSADDLDDNFELDDEQQFMLAYDKDGKPLVPEKVLKDYSVPNAKPKFNDGISDTSSDDEASNSDQDDEENDNDGEDSREVDMEQKKESSDESETNSEGSTNEKEKVKSKFDKDLESQYQKYKNDMENKISERLDSDIKQNNQQRSDDKTNDKVCSSDDSENDEDDDGESIKSVNNDDTDDFKDLKESEEESDNDTDEEVDKQKISSFFEFELAEGDNLKELLTGKTPSQQSAALQRLIKSYDPGLAENNKELLSRLFAHMLQYINDIFTDLKDEGEIIKAFLIFDKLAPYFYDLAQTNKVSTKKYIVELLKEKHNIYVKRKKRVPDLDTLIFFKLVSLLYPTSDYRHPVTTPSLMFMSEILAHCKFNCPYSISRGLFITSLVLEYTVLSKRLVPTAVNFIRGILYLCANVSILNPIEVVPPFRLHRDAKLLNLEEDCSKMEVLNKMAAKDLALNEIDNDFKIRCLNTSVDILKEFFDYFNELEAQKCLFDPHVALMGRIDLDLYPKKVASKIAGTIKYMKEIFEVKTFTPLTSEKKQIKMLRLYEPDIKEVFTSSKSSKSSSENAERAWLQTKYKKEMKGALREIRRDKAYIASVKIKQKLQSDKVRKDKVKQIYKEASIQQGELNKLKRMK
ncbi:unnamed protein product [Diatraea saccharalis]|uniref:Nucleolar protein 14 homolog n=1 Tax=Diatraea saccharalis TaxID=40085 RepID=A0A9N9WH07_9NEOP|nr:unnamed protein product [Diatraea saccharalis]